MKASLILQSGGRGTSADEMFSLAASNGGVQNLGIDIPPYVCRNKAEHNEDRDTRRYGSQESAQSAIRGRLWVARGGYFGGRRYSRLVLRRNQCCLRPKERRSESDPQTRVRGGQIRQ